MIDVVKIWQALIAKEHLFEKPIAELAKSLSIFKQAQETLTTLPLAEIDEKLSQYTWSGASPTKEFEIYPSLTVPSNRQWGNHRKNRQWAVKRLRDQPYGLETAVSLAALTTSDQKCFHRILQAFIQTKDFELRFPDKVPNRNKKGIA